MSKEALAKKIRDKRGLVISENTLDPIKLSLDVMDFIRINRLNSLWGREEELEDLVLQAQWKRGAKRPRVKFALSINETEAVWEIMDEIYDELEKLTPTGYTLAFYSGWVKI